MLEAILENLTPIVGLIVGSILAWAVPYVRAGLEEVQKTDSWAAWPPFKPGYVSMTIYPLVIIGVGMLTEEELLAKILALSFVPAVLYTYGGSRIGHEVVKLAVSFRKKQ